MNRTSSPVADDTIACEAMDWFLRNREGALDEAGRLAFLDWMKRSPEHVRAYMHALALHRQVGEALQSPLPDDAAVPPRQVAAKVVPLFGSVHAPPRAVPRRGRARWWVAAAAACITLLGVGLVPQVMPTEQLYSAGQGELRDLVLPDQTQVRLNADSRLRVRMGWFSRKVELLQGEATFDIARDRRPFEVAVNGLEIRDIGTVFDVSRRLQSTRIGVVSGEVEVWSRRWTPGVLRNCAKAGWCRSTRAAMWSSHWTCHCRCCWTGSSAKCPSSTSGLTRWPLPSTGTTRCRYACWTKVRHRHGCPAASMRIASVRCRPSSNATRASW